MKRDKNPGGILFPIMETSNSILPKERVIAFSFKAPNE